MAQRDRLSSSSYPYLAVQVDIRGHRFEGSALLDTGFSGHLAVSASVLSGNVGLPDGRMEWELADGSSVDAPVYYGMVEIVGFRRVPALVTVLGSEFVLGRRVIDRFKVTLDHGTEIILEP